MLDVCAPAALYVPTPAAARWFAIWTRSHCEQLVRDELGAGGFDVFLPKAEEWSRRGGTRHRVMVPLFPGYLFLHHALDKASHAAVLKARGVVRVLGERWDRLAAIPDGEIEAIRRAVESGARCSPCATLRVGTRVRILDGPLAGVEGLFVRRRDATDRLVLTVGLLQRSVAVEIDHALVEAI